MRALIAAVLTVLLLGVVILFLVPMVLTAAWGPNPTPHNECYPADRTPDASITLIGRCAHGA